MSSKIQCIRDLLGGTCQHRSLHKPAAAPSTNAHLQRHKLHLRNFLRPKIVAERRTKSGHAGDPDASASVGRRVEVEIPVAHGQPDRPTVGDQLHNRIQMTKKLQEVRRAFGQKAPTNPKDDRYQVSHESEHYNLSARLQHLQPCRMNGFTKTNDLKSFEFPINFYS